MMKFKSKLSLVLLMILSLVIMMGATTSMLVRTNAASADETAMTATEETSWYTVTYDDKSLTILLSANLSDYSALSQEEALKLKDTIVEAFRSLVMDKLLGGSAAAGISAAGIPMPIEAPTGSVLGEYAEKLKARLSEKGDDGVYEFEKYLGGDYDSVIKYAISQYIEKHPDLGESAIKEKIEEATKEVKDIVDGVITETAVNDPAIQAKAEDLKNQNEEQSESVKDTLEKVVEDGGKVTLSVTDLLSMLRKLTVNEIEIYSSNKFHISGIKKLLSSLPKPGDVAEAQDKDMHLDFNVLLGTTMGDSEFTLSIGFKGDCTNIKRIAKFIADHIDIVNVDGKYNVKITLPDAFGAVLARLAKSDAIPDEIKHNVFAMFRKTGNELLEDFKTNYTYDQVLDYVKSTDFRKIFASLIDAEKIKSFLDGYDVDLSEFSQEKIDKFIADIFGYLKNISENQSVDTIKEFLKGLGINGMPEQLEKAAQKFFDLLKEIDFEYWNAKTFKEFINDETAFNAKFDELIQRATDSETARKIYDKLVGFAEKFFNKLPETLKESSILDLYKENGEILWDGTFSFDVKGTLTSILNKIAPYMDSFAEGEGSFADKVQSLIDTWFDDVKPVEHNVSLNITATNINNVEYIVNSKVVNSGLLPVGADLNYFSNLKEVGGQKIIAWIDEKGNVVDVMPDSDTKVYALTQIKATIYNGAEIARDIEKRYDGESVELTVKAESSVTNSQYSPKFTYQWYKDGKAIEGGTENKIKITNIDESGAYYCVISYALPDETEISVKSRTINVTINKILVDLSAGKWTLNEKEGYYVYDGTEKSVDFVLPKGFELPEGIIEYAVVGNKGTNAGTYKAYITFTNSNTDMYEVKLPAVGDSAENAFEWEIYKKEVKVTEIPTLEVANAVEEYKIWTVIYDGKEHEAKLNYKTNVDDNILVGKIDKQENLKQTNAGVYTITIYFSIAPEKENNYVYYGVSEYKCTWIIKKANLDLSSSYWAYGDNNSRYEDGCFEYDGNDKTVKFKLNAAEGQNIPSEGITLNYNGDVTKKDANVTPYKASVEIVCGENIKSNYFVILPINTTLNWKIEQCGLDLAGGYAWNYKEAFTYDGKEKEVALVPPASGATLPEGIEFDLSGNKATNAGTYKATAGLKGVGSSNYYVVNGPVDLTWVINKAQLKLADYAWKWSEDNFTYEAGTFREVKLSATDLENKIEFVKYEGNRQILAGEYVAKAYFAVKAEFAANYELAGSNYIEHSWTIVASQGSGSLIGKEVTVGDSTIRVSGDVPAEVLETLKIELSKANYSSEQFNPWAKAGTHAEIVKVYSISMELPENFNVVIVITVSDDSFDGVDAATVHVPVGTTEINKDTCEGLNTSINGKVVSFNATSFSDFVIINQVPNEKQNLWWVWVIDALILILLIVIIFLIVLLLLKKRKGADDEAMVVIDAPEEESEEEPEEDDEEGEEEPEEEPEDDDDDDDETAAVAVLDDKADDDVNGVSAIAVPANDNDERSIYNKSFTARLSQADDLIKTYYSELKNDILAYKGVKSRISWSFDTFNKGREKCIKLQIRGKSLYMYIALNPADVDEKYHIKDVSQMSRYSSVPTMLRIRKPRSLKYAKELVAKLMENMGIERGETPNVQYKIDYKSNEALLQVGLIKIKVSKSNFEDINKKDNN